MPITTPVSLLGRITSSPTVGDWERFVELYTPLLFAWAGRFGVPEADAADLVQDVFVLLVEKLPSFRYDAAGSFRAWLCTILRNRWRTRTRAAPPRPLDGIDLDAVADVGPDVAEEEYRRHVAQRAIALMRADFEPVTWSAFWEFVVSGRPAAEVAAGCGLTVNAVYLAKARVLRRLRDELTGLLD